MFKNMIAEYINKISITDVIKFANSNDIALSENEATIIHNCIQNNYNTIIYGNSDMIFDSLSKDISPDKINKMKYLLNFYKNKYRFYL